MVKIGNDWDERLRDEWDKPYYDELRSFLMTEYKNETVYPPADDIYNALKYTPYDDVKVVILGQDPYHEPGQAQGLSFSVPRNIPRPPSLVNIMKELDSDIGPGTSGVNDGFEDNDTEGILVPWAKQGVLLLNTVLTVRAHQAGSHRGKGWETFTDRIIELLAEREKPMVFILWGANAGSKYDLIRSAETRGYAGASDADSSSNGGAEGDQANSYRHLVIRAPHPSPLSAYRGFFGGRYFSRTNYFLIDNNMTPIDWSL